MENQTNASLGKAMIAMSGGVDSSVAAYLMQQAGWECTGAIMQLHNSAGACGNAADVADARAVARRLGMDFHVLDFSQEFTRQVVGDFIRCYESAETPNPCIVCNRTMKFGCFYETARAMGMDCVVTGHYARIVRDETGRYLLKKGLDESKDQSYVLYRLTQDQLAHLRFPLGEMSKAESRALAESLGFVNARKKDSQDICFVPDGDYAAFIRRTTGREYPEGNFVDPSGKVLGRHRGLIHYTVGQRRGLGVSGGRPLYVRELRPEDNTVVLAENQDLFASTLYARDFFWSAMEAPAQPIRVQARARYHMPQQWATATVEGSLVKVVFDQPQRALTRGQSVVLYREDTVVGGGIIHAVNTQ